MRDIQISRPVLIALVGAILVGGFLYVKSGSTEQAVVPAPAPVQAEATSATGGATGANGATVATEGKKTAAEVRAEKRKAAREKLVAAAEAEGMPLSVYEPLQEGKVVMIFFWTEKGQDDQHVNQSVNEVKNRRGSSMVVIKEPVSNKAKYDRIAKAADITQTPGILTLYKKKADAWQGYIDGAALNSRVTRLTGSSS